MSAAAANTAAVLGTHLSEKRLDRLSRSSARKRRFVCQSGISDVAKSNETALSASAPGKASLLAAFTNSGLVSSDNESGGGDQCSIRTRSASA